MKNYTEVYDFLKSLYKPSRFEESAHCKDFPDYPEIITKGVMTELTENGYSLVTRHSSKTGEEVWFDANLSMLDDKSARDLMMKATARHYNWE